MGFKSVLRQAQEPPFDKLRDRTSAGSGTTLRRAQEPMGLSIAKSHLSLNPDTGVAELAEACSISNHGVRMAESFGRPGDILLHCRWLVELVQTESMPELEIYGIETAGLLK